MHVEATVIWPGHKRKVASPSVYILTELLNPVSTIYPFQDKAQGILIPDRQN